MRKLVKYNGKEGSNLIKAVTHQKSDTTEEQQYTKFSGDITNESYDDNKEDVATSSSNKTRSIERPSQQSSNLRRKLTSSFSKVDFQQKSELVHSCHGQRKICQSQSQLAAKQAKTATVHHIAKSYIQHQQVPQAVYGGEEKCLRNQLIGDVSLAKQL